MSVSAETIISAPSESYALSADQVRPRQPEICSFYSPLIKMLEGEILTLQMSQELTGMMLDRQRFIDLSTSRDIADRELYFGTPETNGNQRLIIVNGFTQYNPATENPWVAPIFEYWQNIFPPLKSNAFLEPKKEWYERHGHTAKFAFEKPNHIWFQNFMDTYNAAIDAISESDLDGQDVWIDGLSAGGMLGEMVLKKLAKKGIAINLITNGSPEVNEGILQLFDSSVEQPGIMGRVHKSALLSGKMDLDYERMQEEIREAATSSFHPDSRIIRFYSHQDNICPPPQDSTAIEVGGPHSSMPLNRLVLETEARLLASPMIAQIAA